jgi:FHA domain
MSVVCPVGHQSSTTDYCDQCGAPIAPESVPAPVAQPTEILSAPTDVDLEEDTSPSARREPCPACGAPRSGDDRYCEQCGHDLLAPAATRWEAVVSVDRTQFDQHMTEGMVFPAATSERRFALDAPQLRIGRRRSGTGVTVPEIDLSAEPVDPGISRMHAVLERQPDGTFCLKDLGSTNGTVVGDDPRPIGPDVAVPLVDGDLIRIGAWTTITIRVR